MARDGCAVLVVDDDRINRALLSRLLEHEGYRPRTAVNGREALVALDEERFDAVLLDIVMPEVDGLEVLTAIKSDARLWHIPVIVISGLDDTDSVVSCLELGADDYVQKPFDPVLLRARLNACLARRQFHDLEVEYQKMVQEQAAELQELRREVEVADGARAGSVAGRSGVEAVRSPVAVLTVGLGGLTDFAGQVDPTTALALITEFHATLDALADRLEGSVIARSPDTLTLVFGGPRSSADPAAAAVGMAVALEEEMAVLSPSTWGAGLAVGDATVGVITDGGGRHVAAVGPVVDLAARLCDRGRGGSVLLDEEAFAAIQRLDSGLEAEPYAEPGEVASSLYRLRRRSTDEDAPPEPGPVDGH